MQGERLGGVGSLHTLHTLHTRVMGKFRSGLVAAVDVAPDAKSVCNVCNVCNPIVRGCSMGWSAGYGVPLQVMNGEFDQTPGLASGWTRPAAGKIWPHALRTGPLPKDAVRVE